jgi:hypothetical protein
MKLQTIYIYASAVILMAFASCKKDLLKINTNPTTTTAANFDPNYLLTTSQLMYTGSTDDGAEVFETEFGGIACFIQHCASTSGLFYGDKYLLSQGSWGSYFDHAYTYQIQPIVDLLHITAGMPQYRNLHQMARIMKAMEFQRLTDIYGDVPYFQAGLGYYDRIYTPVYDSQQAIYTDLLKEVSQATDSLTTTGDLPTGDILYSASVDGQGANTQITEWKKFGYSLLLRIAMRYTKIDPTTAQTYVKKVQGLTMTSNTDNAIIQHNTPGNLNTENRAARALLNNDADGLKFSKPFIDFLKNNNDPRLTVVSMLTGGDTNASDQVGMPAGYVDVSPDTALEIVNTPGYPGSDDKYSRPDTTTILTYSSPDLILTYAETELLLADAANRWGIGGDAGTHYKNGVIAAITQLSAYPNSGGASGAVSTAHATTYYNAHPYNSNSKLGLEQINDQYWACTIFDEYEAWSNWRRSGYPATAGSPGYPSLVPVNYTGNVTNGTIPRRMAYPTGQRQTNPTNYNAAVAKLAGGDVLTARIWWDSKGGN